LKKPGEDTFHSRGEMRGERILAQDKYVDEGFMSEDSGTWRQN
jgi:hypothetical protein